jgi:hypothetical protein
MHSKIFSLALCALAIPASVSARPTAATLARRNVHAVTEVAHPITVRRRNQRAQVQQMYNAAPAAEVEQKNEAAAGEQEKAAAEKAAADKAAAEQAAAGEGEAAQQEQAAAGEGEAAAGEEEAVAGEKEIESEFAAAVALEGGDIKQDIVFTPSTVGAFEFEFQNDVADECTVTENVGAAAAAPPAGFEAIEPNSYTVALAVSKGEGLTLSKIDYIFDAAGTYPLPYPP